MTTTTDADDPVVRPFADWLREQRKGLTHDELSDALHELIAAVNDTGKAGTLTLTIKVAPLGKTGDVLQVTDAVKLTPPKRDRDASLFYTDDDGNLSKSDPNQPAFDSLREVPAPKVKDVTTAKEKQA